MDKAQSAIDWDKVKFEQTLESILNEEEIWTLKNALIAYRIKLEKDIGALSKYMSEYPVNPAARQLIESNQKELEILQRLCEKLQSY